MHYSSRRCFLEEYIKWPCTLNILIPRHNARTFISFLPNTFRGFRSLSQPTWFKMGSVDTIANFHLCTQLDAHPENRLALDNTRLWPNGSELIVNMWGYVHLLNITSF
jgi:hypothetical protein